MSQLTKEQFDKIPAGEVFAKGEVENSPMGIYMTNSNKGKMLKWIAKKGYANDWCIYCHWAYNVYEFVEQSGDKVHSTASIKKLVPCTDEVFSLYRN